MRASRCCGAAALVLLLTTAAAAVGASAQAPAAASPAISADALMATVRRLTADDMEGRAAGSEGGARARTFLTERFEATGLATLFPSYAQAFPFTRKGASNATPLTGVNLAGVCPGTDRSLPAMVLTAHYDHLGVRDGKVYHGADDNASGVAVLLELAAVCRAQPFRRDLIVVALDAEEAGLRGAEAFVAEVRDRRLAVNVNLDMVARGDKGEIYVAGTRHYPALKPILEPVAARAPIAVRFGHDEPGSGDDDWTLQSDHGMFHQAGLPFVYFGVEDHPDYHKPTDTADKIDPSFFAKAAGVVLDALRALDAGLP